jgi:hypothetical protein
MSVIIKSAVLSFGVKSFCRAFEADSASDGTKEEVCRTPVRTCLLCVLQSGEIAHFREDFFVLVLVVVLGSALV